MHWGDQLHLVLGIVRDKGEDDRSFQPAPDQNRIAFGTAKSGHLGRNLDALFGLECSKSPEIFRVGDLQVDGSRIGVDGEFGQELVLDPGDLGKV
jgi:cytolysin (calcineurin-like family phosphatase)